MNLTNLIGLNPIKTSDKSFIKLVKTLGSRVSNNDNSMNIVQAYRKPNLASLRFTETSFKFAIIVSNNSNIVKFIVPHRVVGSGLRGALVLTIFVSSELSARVSVNTTLMSEDPCTINSLFNLYLAEKSKVIFAKNSDFLSDTSLNALLVALSSPILKYVDKECLKQKLIG